MPDIQVVQDPDQRTLAAFDAVIDVRTPLEFAEDHIPGAVNLPVLSNEQRVEVGTIYVQDSRFRARRIGAAHIARNVAAHLETALADKPATFRPLLYCWRGGMRSGAMATILSRVGWRTAVLAGGYKTYRRRVRTKLYDEPMPLNVVLLGGPTGTGKTAILHRLAQRGVQTLDLEAMAAHRGSVFGAIPGRPQPTQKLFESYLLAALERFDLSRPIVVEAESSKIGDRMIPPALWESMTRAARIEVTAPVDERVRYLVSNYRDAAANTGALETALAQLPRDTGKRRLEAWRDLARQGALEALAAELIEKHYDPAYDRAARRESRRRLGVIPLARLDSDDFAHAAGEVMAILTELTPRHSPVR